MKVFVGLFACLVAVQAQPLLGLDDTLTGGGSNPTSAITSLGSKLGGGTGLPVSSPSAGLPVSSPTAGLPLSLNNFISIIPKLFSGSDGTAAFNKFFAILLKVLKANPNGDIPADTVLSTYNDAKNDSDFPINFFNNIPVLSSLGGLGGAGGADNGLSVFLNIFIKLLSSNGTIPASVTSKLSGLSSQGDITPEKFASCLRFCSPLASGLNAEQSNSDSHSDSLDYKHDESTSLSKKSADESNDSSSFFS